MKKLILALMIFAGLTSTASAQWQDRDNRRDNRRYEQRDPFDRRVRYEQRYVRVGNKIFREIYRVDYRRGRIVRTFIRRDFVGYRDRRRDNDFQFNIFLRF